VSEDIGARITTIVLRQKDVAYDYCVIYFYNIFRFTEDQRKTIISAIQKEKTYKDVMKLFPQFPPEVFKVRLMYFFYSLFIPF